ncbi:hypothetical protein SLS56_011838 [Neofusicoccum ribis]|uniref:Uncharacterized protein n=1 Tax=Neofusicoccum ribis TaxID=45134 RepID=A0ABR3SBI9_9PEZI
MRSFLVFIQAIKHMAISEIREEYDTYQSLRAVIFFGVPSDGMKTESLRPLFKEQAQRNMLDNIDELNPAYLREVSSGYMHALAKLVDCTSFYFYEMLLSPTLVRREIAAIGEHKLRWDRNGPPEVLVSSHSATQGKLNENDPNHRVFPVQKTHSDLVKFSSENDTTYKTVVDCLESVITEMGKIDQRDRSLASGENQITEIERAVFQRNQDSRGQYGKRWKWTEGFLQEFTLDMLENACSGDGNRRVFLFVDGINELGRKPAENFIQTFNRFLGKHRKTPLNLEVCISCRYSPRLRDGGLAISLDSENAQDIRYVVENHPVMSRLRRRGEKLHNLILERARGSFGWAYGTLELVTKLYERGERYNTIIAEVKQEQRKVESKRAKNLAMTEVESYSEEDWDDFSDNNLTAYESSDSEDEGQRRRTLRKKTSAFKSGTVPATKILPTRTKISDFR